MLLKLVFDRDSQGAQTQTRVHYEQVQGALTGFAARYLLVCTSDSFDEQSFVELFTLHEVTLLIDIRSSPRFDFGSLNRKRVFSLLEGFQVEYLDLNRASHESVATHVVTRSDGNESNGLLSRVAVLTDSSPSFEQLGVDIAAAIRRQSDVVWDLLLQGPPRSEDSKRNVIFISHANPEDNSFVLWLQAQLSRNGYLVWTDLTHLKAGELFWESIEDTIRKRASRVIVVNSAAAAVKAGVQDEIALAINTERTEKIPGFVIPIRIDNLTFSSFRANIARKNILDFSASWVRGLRQLLDSLNQDRVPKISFPGAFATLWQREKMGVSSVRVGQEMLVSNQHSVVSLPTHICLHSGDLTVHESAEGKLGSAKPFPLVPHKGGWLSFFSAVELKDLKEFVISGTRTFALADFRAGLVGPTEQLSNAARNRLVSRLLNSHWDYFVASRGLISLAKAGPRTSYFPKGILPKDQVEFADWDGVTKKRILVGHSAKRRLHWHLGALSRFTGDSNISMAVRLRVIFTSDDTLEPLNPEKMKLARRAFCKNWWNDRWRTLHLAYISALSNGREMLTVVDGLNGRFEISTKPDWFNADMCLNDAGFEELDDDSLDSLAADDFGSFSVDELDAEYDGHPG